MKAQFNNLINKLANDRKDQPMAHAYRPATAKLSFRGKSQA